MMDFRGIAPTPPDGIWGEIDGAPSMQQEIQRIVKNPGDSFPGVTFRPVGRPTSVGDEAPKTVTVRVDPLRLALVREHSAEETNTSEILRRALDPVPGRLRTPANPAVSR